jgi:hypothetical protein
MAQRKHTLRSFFFKFKAHPWETKEISDEATARSEEIRQLQHQKRLLEHQKNVAKEQFKLTQLQDEIAWYKEEHEPEPKEDFNALLPFLMMLMSGNKPEPEQFIQMLNPNYKNPSALLQKGSSEGFAVHASTPVNAEQISLSDEEIKATLTKIPKRYLKIAKSFPDGVIKGYATKQFNFNEPTLERAIEILRSE